MNICTIATEGMWLEVHARRWIRKVRQRAGKDVKAYLIVAGDDKGLDNPDHPVLREFDGVKRFPASVISRPWFNSVRMSACTLFNVPEMLYIDCDCDVLDDLMGVGDEAAQGILYVASPVMHPEWVSLAGRMGYEIPVWEGNNGFLYLRGDWGDRYAAAVKKVDAVGSNPRISGTFAFNVMLLDNPGEHYMIDEKWSVIWWDDEKWLRAKCIQYCSDRGQKKRVKLEQLWEASKIGGDK